MDVDFWPWNELGIATPPSGLRDVKRAYAAKLKSIDPETEGQAFQELREAYEYARENWELDFAEEEDDERPQTRVDAVQDLDITDDPVVLSVPISAPQDRHEPEATPPEVNDDHAGVTQEQESELWNVFEDKKRPLLDRWTEVFCSPYLIDPDLRLEVEFEVIAYLRGSADDDSDSLALGPEITPEIVALINQHFGWLSDYPGFMRKFAFAEHVLFGLQRIESSSSFGIDRATPWRTLRDRYGLLVAWCVFVFSLIGLIVLILVLRKWFGPLIGKWSDAVFRLSFSLVLFAVSWFFAGSGFWKKD